MERFKFLTENQIFRLKNMLLTEATAISLHQQFDKVYGSNLVDLVLSVDTSNKKKFAEWVLKSSLNCIDGNEIKYDYINDGTLKKMFDLTESGKFQALSYKNLKDAYDAMLEYEDASMDISPAYEDEKIIIYVPSSYRQLQGILKRQYNKTTDKVHWCVASSNAAEYWSQYTNYDEYDIYLIYNKEKNALFLWNDNPEYANKMFNDWNDIPCSPINDGGLTNTAIYWIENQSGDVSIYDVTPGTVLAYLLDDKVEVIDPTEDDLYYHMCHLYTSDGSKLANEWCYSKFSVAVDEDELAVIFNDRGDGDYSVVYIDKDNNIKTFNDIEKYDSYNDYHFFWDNDDNILMYEKYLGLKVLYQCGLDIDYIYYFQPLDDKLNNIIINTFLYNTDSSTVIVPSIKGIDSFDKQSNIIRLTVEDDFEDCLYELGYDNSIIEYNDDFDKWIAEVDLNIGEIIHVYGYN